MTRRVCAQFAIVLLASWGCGADIEPYEPTLGGIDNENVDPDAPPRDVSFVDGEGIEKARARDCGGPWQMDTFTVVIDNQYRNRTVLVRHVAEDCSERDGGTVAPGEQLQVAVYRNAVIRIVDTTDDRVISSWRTTKLNSLRDERIVLRSTDPDV